MPKPRKPAAMFAADPRSNIRVVFQNIALVTDTPDMSAVAGVHDVRMDAVHMSGFGVPVRVPDGGHLTVRRSRIDRRPAVVTTQETVPSGPLRTWAELRAAIAGRFYLVEIDAGTFPGIKEVRIVTRRGRR